MSPSSRKLTKVHESYMRAKPYQAGSTETAGATDILRRGILLSDLAPSKTAVHQPLLGSRKMAGSSPPRTCPCPCPTSSTRIVGYLADHQYRDGISAARPQVRPGGKPERYIVRLWWPACRGFSLSNICQPLISPLKY